MTQSTSISDSISSFITDYFFIATVTLIATAVLVAGVVHAGPLHDAAKNGDTIALQQIIIEGEDANVADADGLTPLIWAARIGHSDVVEMLAVQGNVNFEAKDKDGLTALHWAGRRGHDKVIEILLPVGAKVGARDKVGYTPLHWAAGDAGDEWVTSGCATSSSKRAPTSMRATRNSRAHPCTWRPSRATSPLGEC
jgi:hypothetical protein